MKRLAILDDYLHLALECADWAKLDGRVQVDAIDRKLAEDEAAEVLAPYHMLCHMRERMAMPRSLIERLPNLEFMTVTGKMHRTLDMEAARERGIVVSHVSSAVEGSRSTPELAWGLILAAARNIAFEDRMTRQGHWQRTAGMLLDGKTLGLLGLGRVGRSMAAVGQAFGMRVVAWSPHLTTEAAAEFGVERVDKDELFRRSDVLSIHVVLNEGSRGLVGARELGLMKRRAILVNTARGPIVQEAALLEALRSGAIAGAGLDVFDQEPLPAGHPLLALDNVVLTPHLGYGTRDTIETFYRASLDGVLAYLDGSPVGIR